MNPPADYLKTFTALVQTLARSDDDGVSLARALSEVALLQARFVAEAHAQRDRVQAENSRLVEERRKVEAERDALRALVRALQAHAKEQGWQDVDEPIAALLAWEAKR